MIFRKSRVSCLLGSALIGTSSSDRTIGRLARNLWVSRFWTYFSLALFRRGRPNRNILIDIETSFSVYWPQATQTLVTRRDLARPAGCGHHLVKCGSVVVGCQLSHTIYTFEPFSRVRFPLFWSRLRQQQRQLAKQLWILLPLSSEQADKKGFTQQNITTIARSKSSHVPFVGKNTGTDPAR